jgi:hypothetical protein
VPGLYSGANGQGLQSGIHFYVAPGGWSILNVSDPSTSLSRTPSGSTDDVLGILQVAIKPNGSFSSTTSYSGIELRGANAKITYTFSGRFEAATTTAPASAAGTWREDIAYASGQTTSCTSNNQSWTATLYREPLQKKTVVVPGSYSGANGQDLQSGIQFTVAPGGRSILNVSDPSTSLSCTPSGSTDDHLTISQVAINPDGSFRSTTSQQGVLNGSNATFTYTFAGYFEGPTPPQGAPTVAGVWREDIVFASGNTKMCTSDEAFWTATLQS